MMTIGRQREILAEAVEFGERFPDLPDVDVLEHIEYVFELFPINMNSILSFAILTAYRTLSTECAFATL